MRLLVITANRERAGDVFESLERMDVEVNYLEMKSSFQDVEWKTGIAEGEMDAVVLYADSEVPLAGTVRRVRDILSVPLMVCSGKPSYYQELQCFQAGADDYQDTECRAVILKLRLERLIQLYRNHISGMLMRGGLLENPDEGQFYCGDRSLKLTGREYQVLRLLLYSREEIIPRAKLLDQIWGEENPKTSRALDTVVKQLRRKLSDTPVSIYTCYGRGYQIKKQ